MELKHIPLDQLHLSPLNMRHGKKLPDVSDILPSVRAREILQPLLVRPNASGFEVVAGRRRYYSAKAVEAEGGAIGPVPCAVMESGDDAAAVEASLIENVARCDADEMTQFETFTRLIGEGRTVENIAATFGLTEIMVMQRLALGNLLPKIREAYRADEIDSDTLRYLTMATKAQQKAWLELYQGGQSKQPVGYQLKQWLFGGQSVSTKVALFRLEQYTGQIVTDLFGEDSYFADADMFWELQSKAVAAKREELLAAKWADVILLEKGERFNQWQHEKTSKKRGGNVFISVSPRGEVEVHEGWLTCKAAQKGKGKGKDKAAKAEKAVRPAMTQAMENYLDLHRHAAVRLSLVASPETALRLLVAHAFAASGNWTVKAEQQRSRSNEINTSVEQSPAQAAFVAEREAVAKILALPEGVEDDERTAQVFARLLELSDAKVQRIAAYIMAETLAVGSPAVEVAGTKLKTDTPAIGIRTGFSSTSSATAPRSTQWSRTWRGNPSRNAMPRRKPSGRSRSSAMRSTGETDARKSRTGFRAGWRFRSRPTAMALAELPLGPTSQPVSCAAPEPCGRRNAAHIPPILFPTSPRFERGEVGGR